MLEINTFSIVARCPDSGRLGCAVSTAVPAVGGLCPYGRAGIGMVSTQSWVNPYLASAALNRMAQGRSAQQALDEVLQQDPEKHLRQLGVVDAQGGSAVWTGAQCTGWAGHFFGSGWAIQGNMLTGPIVLEAMVKSFQNSAGQELSERLMLALEAAQAQGGDKRGKQSAALIVYDREDYPWLDARVDEHAQPVAELRRVLTIARLQLLPFVENMPKRGQPAGALPDDVAEMLLRSPPDRPGGGGSRP